jgi:predicted dehydrogenase
MTTTTGVLRWGVLGTAKIARRAVIPAIQNSERGTVVAVASRESGRATAVAEDLDGARAYGSYEDLLAADEVDAVYIPLPNHLHAEWTVRAAEAGKHVLCEKPLTLDAEEAQRVIARCDAAGVLLQEAFMYRFHPQWERVGQLVADGEIGDVTAIQAWFSYFNDDPANIRNVAAFGGGALMDIGCYPISVARFVLGAEPDEVRATVRTDPESGVDVMTSAILRFGDTQATFTVATRATPGQWVHVVGTHGRITVEIPFNAPVDRATQISVTTVDRSTGVPTTSVEHFGPIDQYSLQADAFARAVLEGRAAPVPSSDALANMVAIDAVRAAWG